MQDEGHNHSVVAMSPRWRQSTSVTDNNGDEAAAQSHKQSSMIPPPKNDEMSSLKEENQRLREQLAETQEELRRLQNVSEKGVDETPPTSITTRKRKTQWNYREWINGDHHLVPQQDDHTVEMTTAHVPAQNGSLHGDDDDDDALACIVDTWKFP